MLSRRNFLGISAMSIAPYGVLSARPAWGAQKSPARLSVWLRHRATGEEVKTVFWEQGVLDRQGYYDVCNILRDQRDSKVVQMPLSLLALLSRIQSTYFAFGGGLAPLIVHSGFRTIGHNAAIEGAAKNSMHLYGLACDISIEGIPPHTLARIALQCGAGGIGIYKTFVHVDTGSDRIWLG